MAFAGIKNEKEINDLLASLRDTTRTERPSSAALSETGDLKSKCGALRR
jgi:hypothetical protein